MRKKIKIAALVIILGCMAAGSVIFFLKGISKENGMEEAKETVEKSVTEVMYDYGVRYKNFNEEKPKSELYLDGKKELNYGVEELFYRNGELIGENRAVVKRGLEDNWKYYSIISECIEEQSGEQDNTYTMAVSKKDLFKNGQGDSFDLEGELTWNKESNEILSYSSEDNWGMASIQAVYDDHTLWLRGKAIVPDSIAFNSEVYVLYDFEADRVKHVFEGVISDEDEGIPRGACFSSDGKKALFRSSGYTASDEIVYINGETGEKQNISELIDTEDRDFAEVSFLDDNHVFVAQTRNTGESAPLERGFIWNIETNDVRQIYGEEETLVFNSEKRMYTQGMGIFIIGEKIDQYRIVSTDKEFLLEGVKLLREYEFFPTKDKVVLLKTEENEEEQDIIKELGVLDLKKEQLTFLEEATVLGKEYDTRHLGADPNGSVTITIYDSVQWNDESSFAVNVKDGFHLYWCMEE